MLEISLLSSVSKKAITDEWKMYLGRGFNSKTVDWTGVCCFITEKERMRITRFKRLITKEGSYVYQNEILCSIILVVMILVRLHWTYCSLCYHWLWLSSFVFSLKVFWVSQALILSEPNKQIIFQLESMLKIWQIFHFHCPRVIVELIHCRSFISHQIWHSRKTCFF